MATFTTTDWILIAGFVLIIVLLHLIYGILKDIHSEITNIESHSAG